MTNLNYQSWITEVEKNLLNLKTQIDENEIAKSLYGGFYIWDSKYIENPEIMFIGINPGNGNPNNSGKVVTEIKNQISYMEFLDGENPSYRLAIETIKTFELAGYSISEIRELLNEKSIKTNFYYLITKNKNNIRNCVNELDFYSFNEFRKQSYTWTCQLIKMMRPKVIICEGKSVFDDIQYNFNIVEKSWVSNCGYFISSTGQIVIGYQRIYSNIVNKAALSTLIKKFIKK